MQNENQTFGVILKLSERILMGNQMYGNKKTREFRVTIHLLF